jgi:hypothetical protein
MKKQYIHPTTAISKMVSLQSIICTSNGINLNNSVRNDNKFIVGNGEMDMGVKSNNDEWGNLDYGSIW